MLLLSDWVTTEKKENKTLDFVLFIMCFQGEINLPIQPDPVFVNINLIFQKGIVVTIRNPMVNLFNLRIYMLQSNANYYLIFPCSKQKYNRN